VVFKGAYNRIKASLARHRRRRTQGFQIVNDGENALISATKALSEKLTDKWLKALFGIIWLSW
jgi:virulence-associated protein VapD